MKHRIIVPTDFTGAASQAIRQAAVIAKKAGSAVTLLHVIENKPGAKEVALEKLKTEAENITRSDGIPCDVCVKEGSIFDVIPHSVCEKDFDLMVIGTHGYMGIRQKIFGADIVKLIAKVPVPVLVVQENSPLVESFTRIVLPIGSHEQYRLAVDAVLLFAGIYDVEVHLYSIDRPGFEWSKHMLANIEEATQLLTEKGVKLVRIREEQKSPSLGYARQTLDYAHAIGAESLWMMSVASGEYEYMSKAYKETMVLNEFALPVLCAGGGS